MGRREEPQLREGAAHRQRHGQHGQVREGETPRHQDHAPRARPAKPRKTPREHPGADAKRGQLPQRGAGMPSRRNTEHLAERRQSGTQVRARNPQQRLADAGVESVQRVEPARPRIAARRGVDPAADQPDPGRRDRAHHVGDDAQRLRPEGPLTKNQQRHHRARLHGEAHVAREAAEGRGDRGQQQRPPPSFQQVPVQQRQGRERQAKEQRLRPNVRRHAGERQRQRAGEPRPDAQPRRRVAASQPMGDQDHRRAERQRVHHRGHADHLQTEDAARRQHEWKQRRPNRVTASVERHDAVALRQIARCGEVIGRVRRQSWAEVDLPQQHQRRRGRAEHAEEQPLPVASRPSRGWASPART